MAVSSPAPASNQELRGDPETITGDTGEEAGDWRRRQSSSHSQHTTASSSISVREEVLAEKKVHLSELENLVRAAEMKAELVRKEKELSEWERNIRLRKLECTRELAEASKILKEGRHSDTGSISSPRSLVFPVSSLGSSSTGRAVSLCSPPAEPCVPGPPSQHSMLLLPPLTLQMFGLPRVLPSSAMSVSQLRARLLLSRLVPGLEGSAVLPLPVQTVMMVKISPATSSCAAKQCEENVETEETERRSEVTVPGENSGPSQIVDKDPQESSKTLSAIHPRIEKLKRQAGKCISVETVEAESGPGVGVTGEGRVLRKRKHISWGSIGKDYCSIDWDRGVPPRKMRCVRSSSKDQEAASIMGSTPGSGSTPGPGSSSINTPRLSTPPRKMRCVRGSSKDQEAASSRESTPGPGSSGIKTPRPSSRGKRPNKLFAADSIVVNLPKKKKKKDKEVKEIKLVEKKKTVKLIAKKRKMTVKSLKKKKKAPRVRGRRKEKMLFQKGESSVYKSYWLAHLIFLFPFP